ncbi:MAG: hypothetical protein KDE14_15490, partial [Rhodobacteraceae bacterium]|nr:hypothetical protein [Paracoccaceae bacterium]
MRALKSIGAGLGLWMLAGVAAVTACAQTPPAASENTGPNANIVRWAEGKYIYYGDNGARERGTEKFRLNVHPDG